MKNTLLIFNVLLMFANAAFGQEPEVRRFTGSIVAGMNGSQIDGDGFAGYHKVGLSVGARAGALLAPKWEAVFEILFSQQGSQSVRQKGYPLAYLAHFNCIEVPVLAYFKDWEVVNDNNVKYHRVYFGLGLSYNRILSGKVDDGNGVLIRDIFGTFHMRKNYVMLMGDINFYFTRNWALNLRWSRAPMNIRTNHTLYNPHMFTIRGVFTF